MPWTDLVTGEGAAAGTPLKLKALLSSEIRMEGGWRLPKDVGRLPEYFGRWPKIDFPFETYSDKILIWHRKSDWSWCCLPEFLKLERPLAAPFCIIYWNI